MNPDNIKLAIDLLPLALWQTLYMVFASLFFAVLLGLPLGIILTVTDKEQIKENIKLNHLLNVIVNIGRSFPFAILMVALIPFTRWIVGTSLGTTAAIVPLTIAALPFVARLMENSFKEVDQHILEAAKVMGSSPLQTVRKVFIPEALPFIIHGITLTAITLVGYSAMAGLIGGGGLGQVAIQYGYNRFNVFIMISTVILLVLIVQLIQVLGEYLAKYILKKRGQHYHV